MKKFLIIASVIFVSFLITGAKAENENFKISYNGEVKTAKNIGGGYGVSFMLPDTDETEYYISAIELAVFKKGENDTHYSIYKDKNGKESKKIVINNPDSLTIQAEFGDKTDYEQRTKYKLAYRYYMTSIHDLSQIIIAGENEKDGWRLVGEIDPLTATAEEFSFYLNSTPSISLARVEYTTHKAAGDRRERLGPEFLGNAYLPMDAFSNGVKLIYSASDFDDEDTISVTYTLSDAKTGSTISSGSIANEGKIFADVECDEVNLVLTATDSFGAYSNSELYTIKLDRTLPEVVSEFDDKGFYMKGLELFSDFEINKELSELSAEIYKGNTIIDFLTLEKQSNGKYRLCETMEEDGEYLVKLYLEDVAGNMSTHDFVQRLDNQKPVCTVLTEEDDADSTVYDKWTNETKKIIIDETDSGAGIARRRLRLNSALILSETYDVFNSDRFIWDVSNTETGELEYKMYVYDNSKTKNKTKNEATTGINGNYAIVTLRVLIDKEAPSIYINHTDDRWYNAGYSVTAYFDEEPMVWNGGIKDTLYAVTTDNAEPTEWSIYTTNTPIIFSEGGVYFLHFLAEDNAGNISKAAVRVRINAVAEIIGAVAPTDSYTHTIYYRENGFFVVKNTSYNTRYHFVVYDRDTNDTLKARIRLSSIDDRDKYAETTVTSTSTGEGIRDIEFNMKYFGTDKDKLPDGVYEMFITITETKENGEKIITSENEKGCEVVIKRNSPPTPIISVSDGYVEIEYPEETLAGSLKRESISSKYLRQYKAVKSGAFAPYRTYTGAIPKDDMVVTALYTDIAGNTATATKRIFAETAQNPDRIEVSKDGNNATVDETRGATVYYIGIRREKQKGINSGIFGFMHR